MYSGREAWGNRNDTQIRQHRMQRMTRVYTVYQSFSIIRYHQLTKCSKFRTTMVRCSAQNRYLSKQCRSRWDGSLRAVSSGSRLFAVLFFNFRLKPLFVSVDMSKFKNGRVHFRNSGMKGLHVQTLAVYYSISLSISLITVSPVLKYHPNPDLFMVSQLIVSRSFQVFFSGHWVFHGSNFILESQLLLVVRWCLRDVLFFALS